MRSLEMTAPWQEEDEDVEVEDMESRKHSNDGRDDLTESSSDEAIERKRRKHGGKFQQNNFVFYNIIFVFLSYNFCCINSYMLNYYNDLLKQKYYNKYDDTKT